MGNGLAEARKDPFEAILAQVGEQPMEKQEKKATMLIVDDGEKNRSILTQLFRDTFDITEAVNGKTALARLNEKPVDVILLDTVMPVMDGFELLSEIKRALCRNPGGDDDIAGGERQRSAGSRAWGA